MKIWTGCLGKYDRFLDSIGCGLIFCQIFVQISIQTINKIAKLTNTSTQNQTTIKHTFNSMSQQAQTSNPYQSNTSPFYAGQGQSGIPGQFISNHYSLIGVRGRCGVALDAIQFLFVDIKTGQCVQSPAVGGSGGVPFQFISPPGQWINNVKVKYGSVIMGITFTTNKGSCSHKQGLGGGNGKYEQLNLQGQRITGVRWRSEALIDGLQFIYSS